MNENNEQSNIKTQKTIAEKRKSMPWFRMYTDFLEDPKMICLAFEDQRHFIGILALKSSGVLDQECGERIMNRLVAQKLWVSYDIILDVKKRLVSAGLIDDDWQPVAWDRRQPASDRDQSGAERQKRFRENQRNTLRNAPVTLPEEKRIDTDTDKDKNKKQRAERFDAQAHLSGLGVDHQVISDWLMLRKQNRSTVTETAIAGIEREALKAGISLEAALRECCSRGWKGFKADWVKKDSTPSRPASKVALTEADFSMIDYGEMRPL